MNYISNQTQRMIIVHAIAQTDLKFFDHVINICIFWYELFSFLLIYKVIFDADTTDPTDNVNLSPIQAWRSAYYCLQNVSTGRDISPALTQHFPCQDG